MLLLEAYPTSKKPHKARARSAHHLIDRKLISLKKNLSLSWEWKINPMSKPKRLAIMPLFNFQSKMKMIELDSDLWIRKISQEKVHSMQRGQSVTIIDEIEMNLITHALETEITYEDREVNKTVELFTNTLLSLRLFKSGNIDQKVIFFKRKKRRDTRAFWSWKTISYVSLRPYTIEKKEVSDFIDLREKIKLNLSKHPDLEIPIHRFNKSYGDRLEEKYIDLMIAIESLVRPSGGYTRNQVAIGISMLIGETSKERRDVRTDVDKAYGIRNDIIHGTIYRVTKDKEPLYYRVEEYLRRAIIKVLD